MYSYIPAVQNKLRGQPFAPSLYMKMNRQAHQIILCSAWRKAKGWSMWYGSSSFNSQILQTCHIIEALPSEERCRRAREQLLCLTGLLCRFQCANVWKARLFLTALKLSALKISWHILYCAVGLGSDQNLESCDKVTCVALEVVSALMGSYLQPHCAKVRKGNCNTRLSV